ncbi:hypothetical protein ABK040_015474 [Willaertia magna]
MSAMKLNVLDCMSEDDWFSIFQFLSLQELCNCCLISKEFNEIVNENKCWKFHFLQFSNSPIDKKREINEDNMNWKSLLKNNFSKYSIRLSQPLGNYFKGLNDNFNKNQSLKCRFYDLQKLKDQYIIDINKNNLEIITKYIKDSFILQTIKVLLNRIKVLNCFLFLERNGKIISSNYKEQIEELSYSSRSQKYELKFTLQISGMKNNLIIRIRNETADDLGSFLFDDDYSNNKCAYIIWINYENDDFTTEELQFDFTKRDKSKGFWFIEQRVSIFIKNNLNILDSILQQIIPVRNVSHLNANNFKPIFILLLSKIEELFIYKRGNVINDKSFVNWPKNDENLLKSDNCKQLYHDNLLLNEILTLHFKEKRKYDLQIVVKFVFNSFCDDLENMIIKKNWKSCVLKDISLMKRLLHGTIYYIKNYKGTVESGLGKKVIDDNTFNELIDTRFDEEELKKCVEKRLRMNCKLLVEWKELIDNALKEL